MANGYFERGEIYWVSISDFGGNEVGSNRPALIVSTNELNKSGQVLIAYLTTSNKEGTPYCVSTFSTGRRSYVKCDTLMTVQTNRLKGLAGTLSSAEMREVEDVLEDVLDMGYVDDAALKAKDSEIAERDGVIGVLRAEAAGTAAKIKKKDDEIASLKMEIEMWQKCYGRCMDMLVDTKVNADLSRRVVEPKKPTEEKKPVEPPKQPEEPPKQPEEPNLVDVNSATFNQLRGIGLSNNVILTVIDKRPFTKVEDLKSLPGMNSQRYNIISKKICCVPVATPKPALVEKDPCYEVEETQPVVTENEPAVEVRKVNVNTASATEISEISGMNINACYAITGKRKRDGLFKSLDELIMPPRVTEKMLAKCRDKLEV